MNARKRGSLWAYFVWSVASLFYLYEYIVRIVPSVMEAELEVAFGVGATGLATAVGLYLVVYSPMQLFVGPLFDRYGTRRLLVPASLFLSVSCFLPLIPGAGLGCLGFSRACMGFASSFGFVGVMYLCTVWFPPSRLAMLSGLTTALGMVGGILGQNLLSHRMLHADWRLPWQMCGWIGSGVTALLWIYIPKRPAWVKVDTSLNRWHFFWKSLVSVTRNPQTWIVGFCAGGLFMPLSVFADMWGIPYLMALTGGTKSQAVNVLAMLYLGWAIGAPVVGWLSDYTGTRKGPLVWSSVFCFVLSLGFLGLSGRTSPFVLGAILFVLGLLSGGQVVAFIASVELNSADTKGTAVSVVNMITMLIGGFIQTSVGAVLDLAEGSARIPHVYSVRSYKMAFSLLPIFLLVSVILTSLGMHRYRSGMEKEESTDWVPDNEFI
ncbi:MAG: MFS transporter [Puniceicoccales bacterium]|jgi:MFS family permease|nr:MFS transporter [Puniceicoccales bacterium]